ncbi:MAG TPA: hypothetical protein VGP31_11185 [Planosporangium sp.]|jgi:hypothetical protein|nr:hypothetical protein [Planosporangium sp.]
MDDDPECNAASSGSHPRAGARDARQSITRAERLAPLMEAALRGESASRV